MWSISFDPIFRAENQLIVGYELSNSSSRTASCLSLGTFQPLPHSLKSRGNEIFSPGFVIVSSSKQYICALPDLILQCCREHNSYSNHKHLIGLFASSTQLKKHRLKTITSRKKLLPSSGDHPETWWFLTVCFLTLLTMDEVRLSVCDLSEVKPFSGTYMLQQKSGIAL
jgi:hypothetical protein